MKSGKRASYQGIKATVLLSCALVVTGFFFSTKSALAQFPPPSSYPTNTPLATWSFFDPVHWTSDAGNYPISFTNLSLSWLGDGDSLVVDTNLPAWLDFNIIEPSTGATNLVLGAPGSLTFWFGPNWATTNGGPGQLAQLIDVGEITSNSSYGYWGLSVDPPGSNLWFLAQDGLGNTYGLSAPISWTSNYFHYVALTYSSTNVSIYLDGQLTANDPGGLSIWPSSAAVAGGMYFGSDTNGFYQAGGLFDAVVNYNYELDSNTVQQLFYWNYGYFMMDPFNVAMFGSIVSAPSNPSSTYTNYDIITGTGNLQQVGTVSAITSTNVWITNVVASAVGGGTNNMRLQFTIQGGFDGVPYDTFVNSVLDFSSNTNLAWAWMGQGYHGNTYLITNLPNTTCFLILGTPQDSDGDGITDAYERLVSKTNPYNADTSGDGISDSDKILDGLNPLGYYPQWKLDSDSDGLPDAYESGIPGLNATSAEAPPGLPSYSQAPVQ